MLTATPLTTTGKSLFSQHYLETRLPAQPEWLEDPQPALDAALALWRKAQLYGANWNEAQTEDEFVKPLLAALGWSYIPQAKNSRSGRINRPDYALFADEASKDAAYPFQGNDDAFYTRALAIAEAKYWGRPLSRKDSSGRDTWKTDNNPSHQMVSYLVGTRRPWGILTNGQVWRLYSRDVSSTASEYYEFDLAGLLGARGAESGERTEAFKRFWLFFRRAAFTPDSQGRSFVQRIHEGSASYAREISDKLKELVFDEVMPEIAAGFVAYRRQQMGLREETAESLAEIYHASLSLLYKLLFVLYAEARSLLPVDNPAYWEESLTFVARQVAERIDRGLSLSEATHATRQYDSLLALFSRIDQGDPSLGVPRYDGGLFNPATPANQFLARHKLSDRAVARAVDILVRDAGQPVDYGYISVRNLGSIYEGLLENVLVVDAKPLGSTADASSMLPGVAQTPGVLNVALVNDKGERKATGSFYTPDFIVEYIVGQALDPILAQRAERFAAAMDQIAVLRRKLAHTLDAGANRVLREQLARAERDALEAFLGIKVCDPAMGSGHFLVNAVDHLTDGIIQRMQAYHDSHPDTPWAWNPIQRLLERVRQEILNEMGRQGIAVDPARLDDTALLTRLVMKRCIYGVDLNPLAVELAKLSLWLHSFTVGAPLSFLDHHLRWGNSLVGADVRTVERAISQTESGQLGLFGGP
ncbi:MAG TPA: restriction endonuclease, partial [Anaerolineae bacterium]|nr:restriction endonuclease [Anaerolineae bacterium]